MAGQSQVPYPSVLPVLVGERPELRTLLHQVNNQLGIILANAELLEAKLEDGASRARESDRHQRGRRHRHRQRHPAPDDGIHGPTRLERARSRTGQSGQYQGPARVFGSPLRPGGSRPSPDSSGRHEPHLTAISRPSDR